jgi:hypothetical protein
MNLKQTNMNRFFFLLICLLSLSTMVLAQGKPEPMKPEATEVWEPEPRVVTPGAMSKAPSDAIVLFDGKNLDEWVAAKDGKAAGWKVEGGAMTVVKSSGNIRTKREFGDIQLHIEFRTPAVVDGTGQGRGNSGIFLQQRYEVQVLDSYNNRTYSNGQAASIYKQSMPLVNACLPPGEWQVYDIIYIAPRFNADGIKVSPAYVTVIQNGVLVQNHTEIRGTTEYIGLPRNIAHGKGPLELQDHSNPTSYRNVWVREL